MPHNRRSLQGGTFPTQKTLGSFRQAYIDGAPNVSLLLYTYHMKHECAATGSRQPEAIGGHGQAGLRGRPSIRMATSCLGEGGIRQTVARCSLGDPTAVGKDPGQVLTNVQRPCRGRPTVRDQGRGQEARALRRRGSHGLGPPKAGRGGTASGSDVKEPRTVQTGESNRSGNSERGGTRGALSTVGCHGPHKATRAIVQDPHGDDRNGPRQGGWRRNLGSDR